MVSQGKFEKPLEDLLDQMEDLSDKEEKEGIRLKDIHGIVFGWWYSATAKDNKKFDEDWRNFAEKTFKRDSFHIRPKEILEPFAVKGAHMDWHVALSAVSIHRKD